MQNRLQRSLVAAALVMAGLPAAAQAEPITAEEVADHDARKERRVAGLMRFRFSYPQQLSGSVGAIVVRQPADYECATVCDFKGLTVALEPGLGGAQLSVGWALLVGEKKRNDFFLSDVYMGLGIRGALLRTWGEATLDPVEQTFAGLEATYTVTRVNFSLGLFRNLSDARDRDWLATAGLGWGF